MDLCVNLTDDLAKTVDVCRKRRVCGEHAIRGLEDLQFLFLAHFISEVARECFQDCCYKMAHQFPGVILTFVSHLLVTSAEDIITQRDENTTNKQRPPVFLDLVTVKSVVEFF